MRMFNIWYSWVFEDMSPGFSTFGLLENPTARHTAQKWSRINWIDWSVDSVAVTSLPPKNDQKVSCPHQAHEVPICSMMFLLCSIYCLPNHIKSPLPMGGRHTQLSGCCSNTEDPKPKMPSANVQPNDSAFPQGLAAVRGDWWLPLKGNHSTGIHLAHTQINTSKIKRNNESSNGFVWKCGIPKKLQC